jgi:hypothetical protein
MDLIKFGENRMFEETKSEPKPKRFADFNNTVKLSKGLNLNR